MRPLRAIDRPRLRLRKEISQIKDFFNNIGHNRTHAPQQLDPPRRRRNTLVARKAGARTTLIEIEAARRWINSLPTRRSVADKVAA
jgi:hypothetical protein